MFFRFPGRFGSHGSGFLKRPRSLGDLPENAPAAGNATYIFNILNFERNWSMKTFFKTLALLLSLLLLGGLLLLPGLKKEYEGIYEKTIRLHVLANSDSEEDQKLKLQVRDQVLAYVSPYLEDCLSKEESARILKELLPGIEETARQVLRKEGAGEEVSVALSEEFYPTRTYGELSFPAGDYTSLRIFLGSGEGQNWWCVVFPPLCLDSSKVRVEEEKAGYTEEETALLAGKDGSSKVRFFFLDLAAKLRRLFD